MAGQSEGPETVEGDDIGGFGRIDDEPVSGLQHHAERSDRTLGAIGEPELDLAAPADGAGQPAELTVGDGVAVPRIGIVMEDLTETGGLGRPPLTEGADQLRLGCPSRRTLAEPVGQSGLAGEEERPDLVGREPGQVGAEAIEQLDAAVGAWHGVDGNTGLAQRLDVTADGALGDLELGRQLTGCSPPVLLQDEEHLEDAGGAHRTIVVAASEATGQKMSGSIGQGGGHDSFTP